jgi:peptidoglycan lytic transglycosylase
MGACAALCLLLANCSSSVDSSYGVSPSPRVVSYGDPVPKGGGVYRVGAPYVVAGRVYVPEDNPNYRADGLASWYGEDFHGRLTANGEVFDLNGISAAHPTLPLPCYARVTNLSNGRSIIVRVNDRGPYHGNRIIDVSVRTAQLLGFQTNGTAWVRVEYAGRAPLAGSDDRVLAATLRQDEPAPLPNSTKFAAAKPIVPAALAPVERGPRLASAATDDTVVAALRPASFERPHRPASGGDQLLNGRGLY